MTLPSTTRALLEMQARDNGFDQQLPGDADWLVFASTKAPLRIWLSAIGNDVPLAALSLANVAAGLTEHGSDLVHPLPSGAAAGRILKSFEELRNLLRRAFQLSRALPDEPLQVFKEKTAKLPQTTEVERLTVQRIGQDIFRDSLLDYFDGRCAVTGLGVRELLRASHIKPWAACALDEERLDVFNGLLLSPNLDALFDRALITFEDDGAMRVSSKIGAADRALLGIAGPLRAERIVHAHAAYLQHHRQRFAP